MCSDIETFAVNWSIRFDILQTIPDNKVHGANMGPTRVLSVPDGPHLGPINLAIREFWQIQGCVQQNKILSYVNRGGCLLYGLRLNSVNIQIRPGIEYFHFCYVAFNSNSARKTHTRITVILLIVQDHIFTIDALSMMHIVFHVVH